jgi:N-acetylneuraminic acid mutarotase
VESVNNGTQSGFLERKSTMMKKMKSISAILAATFLSITLNAWAGQWTQVDDPAAEALSGHTVTVVDGTAYCFGGENDGLALSRGSQARDQNNHVLEGVTLNQLGRFDPNAKIWEPMTVTGDPPLPRKYHSAVGYNSKMYVFFGEYQSGLLTDIWGCDTVSKRWEQRDSPSPKPTARKNHAAVAIADQIYLFAGQWSSTMAFKDVWAYNPNLQQWTQKTCNPSGERYGHRACVYDGKMVAYGGYKPAGSAASAERSAYGATQDTVLADLWRYDPATDAWTEITPAGGIIPPGRAFCALTTYGNKMWISGGQDAAGDRNDTWEFNFDTLQWTRLADGPTQSFARAATITDTHGAEIVLMYGGERAGTAINETWLYSPDTDSIGPVIKANGATGETTINYPDALSITVAMNADIYAGVKVDWWILTLTGSSWYYLNNLRQWTPFDGNLSNCCPVYQGALFNLSDMEVLNSTALPMGSYTFWFAVDYPMDGILNLGGPILVNAVNVIVE